jgi:hypothetical protein
MRTLITASLLSAMALSASAMASPTAPQDPGAQSMSVQVVPANKTKLSAYDFKGLQGQYQMSDGATLNVTGEDRVLFAELDGHARTELIPKGSNTFVARGADMILKFERQSNSTNDVSVNMPKK